MSAPAPVVRLDSFDAERGGRSFRFHGWERTLAASSLAEVLPLLAQVERAAADGLHAVGFVAYEAAAAFDAALTTRAPHPGLPLAWFAIFRGRVEVTPPAPAGGGAALGPWRADTDSAAYGREFHRIRELLASGDSYQVNHTLRLRAPFSGDPLALYERLARAQRSAFCAFLDLGSHAILSASPELFFHRRGDRLTLRPMKGTRPRGRWPAEDEALAAELVASPKERAENLMIVDLLRNDAGRVAIPGSVRVDRMFEVERYDTVHQMTSTIRARTRPEATLVELFRALFPCGSVTGAPKVRTMQIIADAEAAPRGAYCGAIGMVSPGEAVFSVAIRTVVVDRAAGQAELGVGSGITWDARAEDEYRECLGKAAFAAAPPPPFELLETLLYEPGSGFFLLDGHLRRLTASAARLGFRFDRRTVLAALHAGVRGADRHPLRVRLVLARDGLPRAEAVALERGPRVVTVGIAKSPVDPGDPLLFHKVTLRAGYDARRAERPDCDDVLLVNTRGELTESTVANLVVELDGRLWTPPLECGLLPGVLRDALLRRGDVGLRVLTPADLRRATGIWLVSSVRRWRRVVIAAGSLA